MAGPVFISHSSRDVKVARSICDAIESRGMACWISGRDVGAGDNFGDAIVDAIERAKVMVLVFSANANNSEEIKKEIALASQHRVTVIPVRVEDIAPSHAFRYELATRQWIDMFVDWDQALKKLTDRIAAIQALAEGGATPAPGPAPAPIPVPKPSPGLGRVAAMIGGAAAFVIVAGGGWFWVHSSAPPAGSASPRVATAPVSQVTAPSVLPPPAAPAPTPQQAMTAPVAVSPAAPVVTPALVAAVAAPLATPTPLPVTDPNIAAAPAAAQSAASQESTVTAAKADAQPSAAAPPAAPKPLAPPAPIVIAALSRVVPPAASPAPDALGSSVKSFKDCDKCPEMTPIPKGSALIGSPPAEAARMADEPSPAEAIIPAPLAVGRYDVTFDEWDACVAEGGCNAWRPGDFSWGRGRQPAIFVSWNDASAYVAWLAKKTGKPYRLLSETEWEYAARGCTTTACPNQPFWFGAIAPELANYDSRYAYAGSPKGLARRRAVAADEGAPNPFGLINMLGNVRQWVADCWTAAPGPPPPGGGARLDGDCADRVTRGGSYDDKPQDLRAAARAWETIDTRSQKIGFRVARTLDP
jgi:formylglycine-generating enzyme required for sulfatase activity